MTSAVPERRNRALVPVLVEVTTREDDLIIKERKVNSQINRTVPARG